MSGFPTVSLVDIILRFCKRLLSEQLIKVSDRVLTLVGGWAIYVLTLIIFIVLLTAAIQSRQTAFFFIALAILPGGIVAQYVAVKMLDAVDRLINSTRTELNSRSFLEVIALIGVLLAVSLPIIGLFQAIDFGSIAVFLVSLFVAVLAVYVAAVSLNPQIVNVTVSPAASIGQEAVGILTFAIKTLYKFVPVGFGVGIVVLCFGWGQVLIQLIQQSPMVFVSLEVLVVPTALILILPLVGYLIFILSYLVIDLYRAILSMASVAEGYRRNPAGGPAPNAPPPPGSGPRQGPRPGQPGGPAPGGPAPGGAAAGGAAPRPRVSINQGSPGGQAGGQGPQRPVRPPPRPREE